MMAIYMVTFSLNSIRKLFCQNKPKCSYESWFHNLIQLHIRGIHIVLIMYLWWMTNVYCLVRNLCLWISVLTMRLVFITMWWVNPQVNWDGGDAFVGACYPVRLRLNFRPHFIKIHKLLPLAVQEFSIFYTNRGQCEAKEGVGTEKDKGREIERKREGKKRILN